MKNVYLTAIALCLAISTFSQRGSSLYEVMDLPEVSGNRAGTVDTIIVHMLGATPVIYASQGGGWVGGHNGYGDIAKMQLFDPAWGVSDWGFINGILLWFGSKEGPNGTFNAKIWEDQSGQPGTELGSTTVSFSQIDTANPLPIGGFPEAAYNTIATFSGAIAVPVSKFFWAGIDLPQVGGDTVGLVSSTDPEFTAAQTHTGEFWDDASFHYVGDAQNWDLQIAWAIYPVMDFTVNIDENDAVGVNLVDVYPNPVVDNATIMYELANDMPVQIHVYDMTGRKVMSQDQGMVSSGKRVVELNTSDLPAGIYTYTLTAGDIQLSKRMVVAK